MSQKGADPALKRQLAASGQALKRQTSQMLPPPSPPPPPMSQKQRYQPEEEEQHLATMQSQSLDQEESVPLREDLNVLFGGGEPQVNIVKSDGNVIPYRKPDMSVAGTVQEKKVSYCNCVYSAYIILY